MKELGKYLEQVRARAPLTLSITNQVTINECANALLAIGASPVMSDDPADAEALGALAAATVINIGTTSRERLEVMLSAGRGARRAGRPVVLDPVGAGATEVRRRAAGRIIEEIKPDIIRGNLAEIRALAGLAFEQKGVDSAETGDAESAAAVARNLAAALGAVVAVTGAVDALSDGQNCLLIEGGHPLMTRLTGTGCLLTAMVGAYVGANAGPPFLGTAAALSHLALAGARAAESLERPGLLGTYRVRLFDYLGLISGRDLEVFQGVRQI
ncbi:MAG: hydroxyethylthiazole kinase [Candidatus Adiutrix sp.]|jgi:hydroxyethylthiazole kinase|nr:hydroxyethylthiazole kinase [Candidatus Adiutrix sp.]